MTSKSPGLFSHPHAFCGLPLAPGLSDGYRKVLPAKKVAKLYVAEENECKCINTSAQSTSEESDRILSTPLSCLLYDK